MLIIGAGTYAVVAPEIAAEMKCFDRIDFFDDNRHITSSGVAVVGKTTDIRNFAGDYNCFIVAVGNPDVRLSLLKIHYACS